MIQAKDDEELVSAYRECFKGRTGEIVLSDLWRRWGGMATDAPPDSNLHFRSGLRAAFVYLYRRVFEEPVDFRRIDPDYSPLATLEPEDTA